MNRTILLITFFLIGAISAFAQAAFNTPGAGNPVIPGYFADPTIKKFGDTYYMYATTDGSGAGFGPAQVWTSKDFVNWTLMPMNWPDSHWIWAPDVMQHPDGKYYYFYCQPCIIHCGVSETPRGPWKNILGDSEAVLIPDRFVTNAITLDGQTFVDDDGSVYMYWGTWGIYKGFGCGAGKLAPDLKSFIETRLIPNTEATDFFEAPFVIKRNGTYYFMYSSGSCHDHTYRVQYATSDKPLGPYTYGGCILETNADGTTYFDCDIPIRGEQYGSSTHKDVATNSGKYIAKEIRAPLGYYVNEEPMEVTFTYDGQAVQVLESTCTDKPTEMWVSKRDLTNDEELPGATLTIKDADGNIVESWVSTDTPHRVTGLHLGDAYTLTETRPADGYALADEITFRLLQKVDEDGNNLQEAEVYYLTKKSLLFWTWDDWKLLDDATVIMRDDTIKVEISKKDMTTMEELPGAELTITDKDGKEIDRWVSTDKPHYIEKLPAGEYTLTEVKAPDGYAFAESVPFTVLPTGEVQQFEMLDDVIKVELSKKDLTTMEELPGAELTITDKDGKEIDRWVSTDKPHYIEKLPAGDYTLTEMKAPDGYAFAESVPFTVLPTGEVQKFEMQDDVIKVEISKVDITTNKELPGAELIITNKGGKVVEHWTSTDKPHYIEKLPAGDYTLTEITAPNGYEIAEDISFTVLPNGDVQRVVMKDAPIPEQPMQPTPPSTPTPTPLIPQTGDTFPLGLLLALAGLSLAGLAALIYKCVHCKSVAQKDDDETE
mgnify:CR=1 FL=1